MSGIANLNGLEKLANAAATLRGMRGGNNLDLLADVASFATPLPLENNYTSGSMPSRTRIDSNGTQTTREQTIKIEKKKGQKRGAASTPRGAVSTKKQFINETGMVDQQSSNCIGAGELMLVDDTRSKGISVKLNKRYIADKSIDNMLAHIMGKGVVSNSWGGRMEFNMNERHRHYEFFRHRVAAEWVQPASGANAAPYPKNWNVLNPRQDPSATAYSLGAYKISQTGFHDFDQGSVWIAPLNRADYEDMSWNLNKMKLLRGQTTNTGTFPPDRFDGFANQISGSGDENFLQQNAHYACSKLMSNNLRSYGLSSTSASASVVEKAYASSYKYNMVFNQGKVCYDFANKGISPAVVEIIVYKVKKTSTSGDIWTNRSMAEAASLSNSVTAAIEDPICNGYIETCVNKLGTDQLNGRIPQFSDVSTNPRYPFLPVLKKTRGIDSTTTEHQRVKFALKPGGRRSCEFVLGGDIYDPAMTNNQVRMPQTSTPAGNLQPTEPVLPTQQDVVGNQGPSPGGTGIGSAGGTTCMDDHSFIICMSVQGVKMSAQFQTTNKELAGPNYVQPDILGDVYCGGDVQYYAKYEEQIGACSYKAPHVGNIYINGNQAQLEDWVDNSTSAPISMKEVVSPVTTLSINRAVRIPPSADRVFDTSGVQTSTVVNSNSVVCIGDKNQN